MWRKAKSHEILMGNFLLLLRPRHEVQGEFFSIPGSLIENYISALNENWSEFEKLKSVIPNGGDFSKPGKMEMNIRVGHFAQGVCIHSIPYANLFKAQQLEGNQCL